MENYYHRLVQQIEPENKKASESNFQKFSVFFDVHNIILLGDLGSGKTYTFQAASQAEDAVFLQSDSSLTVLFTDSNKINRLGS